MSIGIFTALVCSGLAVGFINTLAGGGTVISITLFMMLGLDPMTANGTNRIPIVLQNLVAVANFRRNKLLDMRKSVKWALPVIAGSILGSLLSIEINNTAFGICFLVVMLLMALMLLLNPTAWIKGNPDKINNPTALMEYFLLFLVGIYAGFIHVGAGYFLLAIFVLMNGYNLLQANAIKNFMVLLYVPFSLAVFIYHGKVNYEYGFIHAIGNIIGAYVASRWAVNWGINFIRWLVIVLIALSCVYQLVKFHF
ncbi:MAG: sulfite exporter TauE/SafE family protein [Lentimicrobiaceae bacterium]|nr:sulfite exporter TauE/SafE family protein [Lentimicrobiaceae bacterium]